MLDFKICFVANGSISVSRAIYAVAFIDRFAMINMLDKIVPLLIYRSSDIPEELRFDVVQAADKIPNGNFLLVS